MWDLLLKALLNHDMRKQQWEAFVRAPLIIAPLLILAVIATCAATWWFRGTLLHERIAVLETENKSQSTMFEYRLRIAAEKLELSDSAKVEIVRQLNDLKTSSIGNDQLSARVAKLEVTVDKLSAANNAIRSVIMAGTGAATGQADVSGAGAAIKSGPSK